MRKRSKRSTLEDVATAIKQAIDDAGISQAQLADGLGVSQQRVSQMLSGRFNITVASLARIADAIGVSLEVRFT